MGVPGFTATPGLMPCDLILWISSFQLSAQKNHFSEGRKRKYYTKVGRRMQHMRKTNKRKYQDQPFDAST